jgi:hypothetical protein
MKPLLDGFTSPVIFIEAHRLEDGARPWSPPFAQIVPRAQRPAEFSEGFESAEFSREEVPAATTDRVRLAIEALPSLDIAAMPAAEECPPPPPPEEVVVEPLVPPLDRSDSDSGDERPPTVPESLDDAPPESGNEEEQNPQEDEASPEPNEDDSRPEPNQDIPALVSEDELAIPPILEDSRTMSGYPSTYGSLVPNPSFFPDPADTQRYYLPPPPLEIVIEPID